MLKSLHRSTIALLLTACLFSCSQQNETAIATNDIAKHQTLHVSEIAIPEKRGNSVHTQADQQPTHDMNSEEMQGQQPPTASHPSCPLHFAELKLCAKIGKWVQIKRSGKIVDIEQPRFSPSESAFDLFFWDENEGSIEDGPFVDPEQEILVILWMHGMDMEHGSLAEPMEINDDGGIQIRDVRFNMSGKWQVVVLLTEPDFIPDMSTLTLEHDAIQDSAQISINVLEKIRK